MYVSVIYVLCNGFLWNVIVSAGKLSESFSHVFLLLNGVKCSFSHAAYRNGNGPK